ncbi:carotenoid oxygenase family protein [Streptomyces sp. NPDC059718]
MSGHTTGLRSLTDEVTVPELPVRGRLPRWLDGVLLRNGPALFEAGERRYRHWFDGQAMLHRFAIEDGRVSYANRFLDVPSSRTARHEGRIGYQEFATDPCRSLFARVLTPFLRKPSGNANVSVARFGERFVALTETPMPVEFDPRTLETVGVVGYEDALAGQWTTAHPHQDPVTGELVNFVAHFARRSEYRVYRQSSDGTARRRLLGSLPVTRPGYMHSFAITDRHVVLVEFPLVVNPPALLLSGRPFIENYRWRPERGTRFIVMDRRDGTVRRVAKGPAFFAFHHVNAFEDGDALVLDLCAYEDPSVIDALYLDRLRDGGGVPQARPTRYRIGADGAVTAERLGEEPMELPRIDYGRCNGRPYRFAYGVGSRDGRGEHFTDQLVRLDTADGGTVTWSQEDCYPGEPVFVAAPEAGEEGEGVVLSVVLDAAAGSSFLLVLDAATFRELARAEVPHAVPFGFHGIFSGGTAAGGAAG